MITSIIKSIQVTIKSALTIFLISTNILVAQNLDLNRPKNIRTSEAYGFILGQEFTINQIKSNFPQYKINAERAETLFNVNFGKCKEKMIVYLTNFLGTGNFATYNTEMNAKLSEKLGPQILDDEIIEAFLTEVENRSKGNIPSTILETLLSFQFSDYPSNEFTFGFVKTFKTIGHKKSKNTDWQLKVPISWRSQEADRPNIIQKFTSDYGSGSQSIMIMVSDIPNNQILTNEEIKFLLTTDGLKTMIPEGARYISSGVTTIDNIPSGILEIEQVVNRVDFNVKIRMIQFVFFYNNKLYSVQCMTSALSETANLDTEMKKYLPLFKIVANSVVVNQQYKSVPSH